jgi:hypothetical protein
VDLGVLMRPARAAVFAAVCVGLTAFAHGLADNRRVGPEALAVGFVAAKTGGRSERSQRAITVGLLAGQAGLHLLFTFVDDATAVPQTSQLNGTGQRGTAAMPQEDMAHHGQTMLIAHLAAAVPAGWWLRGGEAACWRLVRRAELAVSTTLREALVRLIELAEGSGSSPCPVTIRSSVCCERAGGISALLAYCAPRRGPPRGGASHSTDFVGWSAR